MIKIQFYHNNSKQLCGFKMTGHAGYSKHGSDIVCASVSILAINTVNSIEALTDEPIKAEYDDEGGFLEFILPELQKGDDSNSKEALLLLESLELGITNIGKDYKKYIHIAYKEV